MEQKKPSNFITRFEIINGTNADYTRLKGSVEAAGFTKIIKNDIGVEYLLPHGMYFTTTTNNKNHVLDVAMNAVRIIIRKQIRILVTESNGSAWVNLAHP